MGVGLVPDTVLRDDAPYGPGSVQRFVPHDPAAHYFTLRGPALAGEDPALRKRFLGVMFAAGVWVGERILPRDDGAVEIRAHAFQWGFRFTHPGPDGAVETVDLLILPAGQPVDMVITSEDVIHSFWVPQLAGKMDAIPGHTNRLRLQADAPGRHGGLCAEFCGLGHGVMQFEVLVVSAEDWGAALADPGAAMAPNAPTAREAVDD
jgi:cytochrome c oxidase subunit 2/cytochrome aa3-600 menaquinol oxidase subunit 2